MKRFLIPRLLPLIGLIVALFSACDKDGIKTVAHAGTSGALSSSATAVTLDKETLAAQAITFTRTDSEFGFQAGVIYSLQFAPKGTNFAAAKEVVLPRGVHDTTYTGFDFNNLLLSMNLSLETDSEVEVRLKSALSTAIATYSNVLTIRSKPIPLTAWIYMPGAYQGWNPATADSLISPTGNGIYTGVIVFTPGNLEFKMTPRKNWEVNYGDGGDGKISATGGNFKAPAAGMMLLTFDMNSLSWSIEPSPVWSLIGNAIPGSNWVVDTDMKFVNDGTGNWIAKVNLTAGFFKIRRNHDWGTNLGADGDGRLKLGGGDLAITEAGNYTITMNPTALTYSVVKH